MVRFYSPSVSYFTIYFIFYGIWMDSTFSYVSAPLLFASVTIYLITCGLVGVIVTYANLVQYHLVTQ